MKKRLSTKNEITLIATEIVNRVKKDGESGLFDYDYTEDEMLDDYISIKNNIYSITIETTNGYNIINAIITELDDDGDAYDVINYTFINFHNDKMYPFEGDFIRKNLTEEIYVKIIEEENKLDELARSVELIKYMLENNQDNEELKIKYQIAVKKLNDYQEELINNYNQK